MKCPLLKAECPESIDPHKGCPWWTVLVFDGQNKIGRCAIAWLPVLQIENRTAIENLSFYKKSSSKSKRKKRQ